MPSASGHDVQLLLLNPNTSAGITERMAQQARLAAGKKAGIQGITAEFGPKIIGSRAENAIAAHAVLDAAARHHAGFSAIIVGSSMDTGLIPLRELLAVPVVGMAHAAIATGLALGARVGCLTLGTHLVPLYEEMTRMYGFSADVVLWRAMELPAAYSGSLLPEAVAAVGDRCRLMVEQDRVDAVVLCAAVLTGCAAQLGDRVPVPVIDCIDAATRTAMMLAERADHPAPRSGARPLGRDSTGLGSALAGLLARRG